MPNPVDIIVEGGIFTYVVLFVGLIHALVWVVQLVTAKRVNLMPALWSVPVSYTHLTLPTTPYV